MAPRLKVQVRRIQVRLSRRKRLVRRVLTIYLLVLGIFSGIGDRSLWASYQLWNEQRRLDSEISQLESETSDLRLAVDKFRDDRATIERYAREELHLAGPNEIHYIFR